MLLFTSSIFQYICTNRYTLPADFPSVNWVVQLDCPEDANTYIHRAGRTARYETDGQSLLVLLPSEEQGMLKQLADKKIPIEQIRYRTDTVFVESSFTITTTR